MNNWLKVPLTLVCLLGGLCAVAQASQKVISEESSKSEGNRNLSIVSSIPPVGLLVQAIAGPNVEQKTLLEGNFSVHGYSLRPSEAKMLKDADIVFWISPQLEGFLQGVLKGKHKPLLPSLEGEGHHSHHGEHESLHLWLSPQGGLQLGAEIVDRLSQADPLHQLEYQQRWQELQGQVAAVDKSNRDLFKKIRRGKVVPWIIQHNAYDHFQKAYDLPAPLVFSYAPEHSPSLKRLGQLKRVLNKEPKVCVVLEPNLTLRPLLPLLKDKEVVTVSLDPLGRGAKTYPLLLRSLAQGWSRCLLGG